MNRRATAITARVKAVKKRLLVGGMLRSVEWLRKTGPIDVRGRQGVSTTLLDALIQTRPGLDRGLARATDRSDNTVLIILDPVAILDTDTFRWGDQPHVYSVKKVDGLLQNEATGVRFLSEVTVLR